MPVQSSQRTAAILGAVVRKAKARKSTPAVFIDFLKLYYANATEEDLVDYDAAELLAMAERHWHLARQRKAGQALIEVFQPDKDRDGWHQPRCVLMTVTQDMPFLVDSLSLAVREVAPGVEWLMHPVMHVRRDRNGRMIEITRHDDGQSGQAESLVHLQFDLLEKGQREVLQKRVQELLRDLKAVVEDWQAMLNAATGIVEELASAPVKVDNEQIQETQAFLRWLTEHRFTFLGYCRRSLRKQKDGSESYENETGTGLGLLRDELPKRDPEGYVAPAAELDKYARSTRVLVIARGNTRSWIHHPEYMDVISIKRFDDQGRIIGLHRFIGLFSMEAYAASPRLIPGLRNKVVSVMKKAGFRANSHAAKNLQQILETLPRDELFQSSEDELYDVAMGILALRERQRIKLFIRQDRYRRYYACMVYMPRENYSREVRVRVSEQLRDALGGDEPEVSTEFLRRGLARIYYIVPTPDGQSDKKVDREAIEQRLLAVTRTWRDEFHDALFEQLPEDRASQLWRSYRNIFPTAYTSVVSPVDAVIDVRHLAALAEREDEEKPVDLVLTEVSSGDVLRVYTRSHSIALSDLLPTLEHFGLRVLNQRPFEIDSDGIVYEVQELDVSLPEGVDSEGLAERFRTAFLKTWDGEVENDGFNRLVLDSGLDWRQVALLRAVCKYLLQTGLPFSQGYIEELLASHADITRRLYELFVTRFDPDKPAKSRPQAEGRLIKSLEEKLDAVASLDADRVLRAFLGVVTATQRTNYFQHLDSKQKTSKPWVSLKIASAQMPELPEPRPLYETFVYAPNVEGIHLRGGMVARGGLRWSDRREDFRTEVLGLMKAQMVKNTVIVPHGAKGGFVVKDGPSPADREAWVENGKRCYTTFIRGLLDITDNLKANRIVPPKRVVRHDDDDAYLVVAADKGTATFSDLANSVSEDYGHWLGDAFASGGSAGYDHKKMGITARGAWECVKRHFREMGTDIQREDFTVAGIGDMGGDVFGNGMLLSRHIKLVAAFNHMHIFLDPDPNPASSFSERQRLFKTPRTTWADYDKRRISKGGGVFERSSKRIELSPEIRECLDIKAESLTPNELISAILRAPVDLLWNGGIGTYVKAHDESHADVGDRANDALRVDGRDLRCRVVGEGGNLGLTQAGRIEFALNGGRINTDAIDNSAGVDSSDREVNIKIPLNKLLQDNKLKRPTRDKLLVEMTEDVAQSVLRTNYLQGQAISVMQRSAATRLDEHANLIRILERSGLLNRSIEGLPDDDQLAERSNKGEGLTRPELAVLLSYSKLSLYDEVLASPVPDEAWLDRELHEYFPPALNERHGKALAEHPLRREIISTHLTNLVINRMGAPFCHRLAEEHGVTYSSIVKAFYVAAQIYDAETLWASIDALDNRCQADLQLHMCERISGLLKHAVIWFLYARQQEIGQAIERYRHGVSEVEKSLKRCMTPAYREEWDESVEDLVAHNVPRMTAERMANTKVLGSALDIVRLALERDMPIDEVAAVYFNVGQRFSVPWLLGSVVSLQVDSRWQALARATLREDTYRLHSILTARVLACRGKNARERLANWEKTYIHDVNFALHRIEELQNSNVADFMGLTVAVRELRKLRILKK